MADAIIKVKRLTPTARLPTRATDGSAGWDLYADQLFAGSRVVSAVSTGIAIEIPPGFEGQIRARSGLAFNKGVGAFAGTIDSDYRGEVKVLLHMLGGHGSFLIAPGDRIAQLVVQRVPEVRFVEVGSKQLEHVWGPTLGTAVYCKSCKIVYDSFCMSDGRKDVLWNTPCIVSELSPTDRKGGFGSSGR